MTQLEDYIKKHLANLSYFFTKEEMIKDLGLTPVQFKFRVYRSIKKGIIKRVTRDSFMIVPVEYSKYGAASMLWIVEPLMRHLGIKEYYVGLLNAAFLHKATDRNPSTLQIMVNKMIRDKNMEDSKIEFHVFKEIKSAMKEKIFSPIDTKIQASSREQTALDLIRFHQDCGYLGNVAAVIKKLLASDFTQKPSSEKVFSLTIKNEKNTALLQRLGYILEFIQLENLASIVEKELSSRKMQYISLRPDLVSAKPENRNERFKIAVNDSLKG